MAAKLAAAIATDFLRALLFVAIWVGVFWVAKYFSGDSGYVVLGIAFGLLSLQLQTIVRSQLQAWSSAYDIASNIRDQKLGASLDEIKFELEQIDDSVKSLTHDVMIIQGELAPKDY
ncbi:MAG: hypothetical protein AAF654_10955 [Myxococcota bacterium]